MKPIFARFTLLALLSAASVGAQTREAQNDALQGYLARAGSPVDHFPYRSSMQKWELVGPNRVVVWTRVNEAWLLSVDEPCSELEYTPSIALTSSARQVRKRFDYVIVGKDKQRCAITEIRPIEKIDGKAEKAEA